MKRLILAAILCAFLATAFLCSQSYALFPICGCMRDAMCINQFYPAPCIFPPVENPCAVPCRPPALQPQAVPCAYQTACPSGKLPCHGVAYGRNPYPLFR